MKLAGMVKILVDCENERRTAWPICTKCPLDKEITLTPNVEGSGSVAEITLRIRPCSMLEEIAMEMKAPEGKSVPK